METVPQPEKKEWEDNPLAVRALYRVLPFLDRTVKKELVGRLNNDTGKLEAWRRTTKQSGREVLRNTRTFLNFIDTPSADGVRYFGSSIPNPGFESVDQPSVGRPMQVPGELLSPEEALLVDPPPTPEEEAEFDAEMQRIRDIGA